MGVNFRYYRRIATIKLWLWISLVRVNVAGAFVKLAYKISPTLEQHHREIYGRDWVRRQTQEPVWATEEEIAEAWLTMQGQ